MNKTTLATITLIVGLIMGHLSAYPLIKNKHQVNTTDIHQMPDGSMMHNMDNMKAEMDGMIAGLQGKTGDEFDKAFISEMIIHHEGAVDMAELALTNAKHQEIKDLANAIITAQNKEIADMKTWQRDWYNK
jgi:uncharacterized protein (DUF305 family)